MIKRIKRYRPGLPPGWQETENQKESSGRKHPVTLVRYLYSIHEMEEAALQMPQIPALLEARVTERERVIWLDIRGSLTTPLLKTLQETFHFHPLLLEDLAKGGQRPKLETADEALVLFLPPLPPSSGDGPVLILADGIVISLSPELAEGENDVWAPVADRLRRSRGLVRGKGPDYLFYALIDCYVDFVFPYLNGREESLDLLEEQMLENPENPRLLEQMHTLRREILPLRRYWHNFSEVVGQLMRSELPLLGEGVRLYMRDVEDHLRRLQEARQSLQERLNSLMDYHLARVSHSMNSVMKVLTVIATIFIPLTFIAGIYGMNFQHMPELSVWWAYPAVLGSMFLAACGMVLFFRRKKWL